MIFAGKGERIRGAANSDERLKDKQEGAHNVRTHAASDLKDLL
jgi:hypothetical protein